MSENHAIEFDAKGEAELSPIFIGKISIKEYDAESIIRAAHRADDAIKAKTEAVEQYYHLFIGFFLKLFCEARDNPSIPADDVHDEALSQFEGQMEHARVRLVETGVYSSISVKAKTHDQYMTNLRRCCRLKLDFAEVDGSGQSVFAKSGSMSAHAGKREKEIEAAELEARAEKRLKRMVESGEVATIEEARQKLAGPQLTADGVKAAEATTRQADKNDPLSGLSLSMRNRLEPIIKVMVEIDNSGNEKAKQELGNIMDKQLEFLLGEKGKLAQIVDFHGLKEAAKQDQAA